MERVWAADRLRERLKTSQRVALKARNSTAIAALRSAASAIASAEAVDHSHASTRTPGTIPTAHLGVGVRDVARRQLSVEDITKILRAEVVGRTAAAAEC